MKFNFKHQTEKDSNPSTTSLWKKKIEFDASTGNFVKDGSQLNNQSKRDNESMGLVKQRVKVSNSAERVLKQKFPLNTGMPKQENISSFGGRSIS